MKVMQQDVKQDQEQVSTWHMQPQAMMPNGDWLIRMRLVGIRMNIDIGGNKIVYDSQKKSATSTIGFCFDQLLNADFKTTVQPDGTIRRMQGVDELLKTILEGSSSPAMMKSILTEEGMKKSIAPLVDYLPSQPVRIGDRWTRREMLDLGPIGQYVTNYSYTLKATSAQTLEIHSTSSLKYAPPGAAQKGDLPFVIQSATMRKGHGEGRIVFDRIQGRLRESTQRLTFAVTLGIEVGGMVTIVDVDQVQTARVRTMSDNPLAPREKR